MHLLKCTYRFSFDTETNKWETIASMNVKRDFASIAILDGHIFIAGGYTWSSGKSGSSSVEVYDPKKDKWVQIAEMNKGRSSFALLESNGSLYAIGYDKVSERYDPVQNSWTEVCEMELDD